MLNKILVFTCFTLLLSFFAPLNLYSKATRDIAIIEPPCLSSNTSNCTLEQENHCASVVNNTCAFGVFFAWIKNNFLLQRVPCATTELRPVRIRTSEVSLPMIHVYGDIFEMRGQFGDAKFLMDDAFVHIGRVQRYIPGLDILSDCYNFQTNHYRFIGADLYRIARGCLMVVVDGYYTLFQMIYVVENWLDPEYEPLSIEDYQLDKDQGPDRNSPRIHIHNRLYSMYGKFSEAKSLMDDTYTYIGRVQSYRPGSLIDPHFNFETNHYRLLGARLYHTSDDVFLDVGIPYYHTLIVVVDGYYTLFKFLGEWRGGPGIMGPPWVRVNDRTFLTYGRENEAQRRFDDTFVYVGRLQRLSSNVSENENFQTNMCSLLGGRIYHSGDYVIIVIEGSYFLFQCGERRLRFDG